MCQDSLKMSFSVNPPASSAPFIRVDSPFQGYTIPIILDNSPDPVDLLENDVIGVLNETKSTIAIPRCDGTIITGSGTGI